MAYLVTAIQTQERKSKSSECSKRLTAPNRIPNADVAARSRPKKLVCKKKKKKKKREKKTQTKKQNKKQTKQTEKKASGRASLL